MFGQAIKLIVLGACLCALTSCLATVSSDVARVGGRSYASVPEDAPVPILLEKPKKKYEVIGIVTTSTSSNYSMEVMFAELRRKARQIGGEAVIVTSKEQRPSGYYSTSYGFGPSYFGGYYGGYGYGYGRRHHGYGHRRYHYYPRSFGITYGFGSSNILYTSVLEGEVIRYK